MKQEIQRILPLQPFVYKYTASELDFAFRNEFPGDSIDLNNGSALSMSISSLMEKMRSVHSRLTLKEHDQFFVVIDSSEEMLYAGLHYEEAIDTKRKSKSNRILSFSFKK